MDKKYFNNRNLVAFEPQTFSSMDDSLMQSIGEEFPEPKFANVEGDNDEIINAIAKELSNSAKELVNSVDGYYENEEEFSGFQLFGIGKETDAQKARKKKRKEAIERTKKNLRDAGKTIQTTVREIGKNSNLKKVVKGVFLTYNPAVAIPRSSALVAFRFNLFGISSRLYPAFLDEAALKKGNFNVENAEGAKRAWDMVSNFWEDKLGGDKEKLREAISGAWNKPIFHTKKSNARQRSTGSFDGSFEDYFDGSLEEHEYLSAIGFFDGSLDEHKYSNVTGEPYSSVAVAGYITAGLSIISGLVGLLGKAGAKKNPYNEGSAEAQGFDNQLQQGGTPPPVNQAEMNKIIAAAASDKAKGLGLDSGEEEEDEEGGESSDKIMGIPKVGFYVGVSVLAVAAIGLTLWKLKKK